jgi:uncharacterized protein
VRVHEGESARIELPPNQIARLAQDSERAAVIDQLSRLGFQFISLDLMGFRSGGLNTVLPLATRTSSRMASQQTRNDALATKSTFQ